MALNTQNEEDFNIFNGENQTHYQVLNIDNQASPEMIELAYQQLLKDAKEKLQDSPLYFQKEKILNEAYSVLSNPEFREAYDRKLVRKQAIRGNNTRIDRGGQEISTDHSKFIKIFAVFVVLVIAALVLIPSGEDRSKEQVAHKQLDNRYSIQQQRYSLDERKEDRMSASEQKRLELQEKREQARLDWEERRLKMQEEREERRIREERRRENERLQRKKEYEREKRSKELIRAAKKADYDRSYNRNYGNSGSMGR